jgi:hypothetical protein
MPVAWHRTAYPITRLPEILNRRYFGGKVRAVVTLEQQSRFCSSRLKTRADRGKGQSSTVQRLKLATLSLPELEHFRRDRRQDKQALLAIIVVNLSCETELIPFDHVVRSRCSCEV